MLGRYIYTSLVSVHTLFWLCTEFPEDFRAAHQSTRFGMWVPRSFSADFTKVLGSVSGYLGHFRQISRMYSVGYLGTSVPLGRICADSGKALVRERPQQEPAGICGLQIWDLGIWGLRIWDLWSDDLGSGDLGSWGGPHERDFRKGFLVWYLGTSVFLGRFHESTRFGI